MLAAAAIVPNASVGIDVAMARQALPDHPAALGCDQSADDSDRRSGSGGSGTTASAT